MSNATVITVMIRKGGSAKTTTAINLAKGLAKQGKRVLLIDADSQGNVGMALGIAEDEQNLAGVLGGKVKLTEAIKETAGLYLLMSGSNLSEYEARLTAQVNLYAFKMIFDTLRPMYDFIVIDTPPSDGVITRNALVASDYALIPAQAQTLAVKGIGQAIDLVQTMTQVNPNLKLLGVLPTMVQANTNVGNTFLTYMKNFYADYLLPYPIPLTIKASESQLAGIPLVDYAESSSASQAYTDLAKYVITKIERAEEQ